VNFAQALIVEREDGRYQIGLDDEAPGPFETMQFAQAVAAKCTLQKTHETRTGPGSERATPSAAN
jgi:hypothetical protein